jgi:hypothetical protein
MAFADVPFDIVITTNFDFLLEKAYETRRKSYYSIVEEEQLAINSVGYDLYSQNKTTAILKIHGDLNHPKRMVLTEEDYDLYAERSPLMSTFIANLLVMRTPLFISYRLEDPDFRAIWQIIGSRLGKLRRAAYTLSVTADPTERTRFERRGVKVITLQGGVSNKNNNNISRNDKDKKYQYALRSLFEELLEYWLSKISGEAISDTEETQSGLLLPS